jgi:uncharacterized protein YjbJ (UPF0337 family)
VNHKQFENKIHQEASRVKEDMNMLVGDSAARFDRLEGDISETTGKAREDVTTWVEDSAAQLSQGIKKVAGDAKETMAGAAVTVNKEVGRGLSQYNAKAQEVAEKVSPDLSTKAARYPWVSISIALVLGFILGGLLLKPIRQTHR